MIIASGKIVGPKGSARQQWAAVWKQMGGECKLEVGKQVRDPSPRYRRFPYAVYRGEGKKGKRLRGKRRAQTVLTPGPEKIAAFGH